MKKIQFISAVIGMCTMLASAQDVQKDTTTTRSASYGVGYSVTSLLDNAVSPFTYKSDNVPFHFRYTIDKGITEFEYDFNGIVGFNYQANDPGDVLPPEDENSPESTEVEVPELSSPVLFQQQAYVRYLTRVYQYREGKFSAYLGGEVREQFFLSFAEEPTFTFAELNLDLALMLSYRFNDEHSIKAYLSGTLLGTRVNLPNANVHRIIESGPDGILTSPSWAHQVVPWDNSRSTFSLEYTRQLSEEWSIGCEYNSSSYHYTEEPEVKYNDRSLVVKLTRTL